MQIRSYDEVDPYEVQRLTLAAFSWAFTERSIRIMCRTDPRYLDSYAMYAVERGKPVAQVVPLRFPVRLTTGVEEVGGLQGVCSLPSVWGQGYVRRLSQHVHGMFRDDGLRISTLTTSRNIRGYRVYPTLGYVDLAPFYIATRRIGRPGRRAQGIRLRPAKKTDLPRIQELYTASVRGLCGWTERFPETLPMRIRVDPDRLARYLVAVRNGALAGYLRTRPYEDYLMEEVVAPRAEDFQAIVRLRERKARGGIATVNWITCRRDRERFKALGYELDGPIPDTTMAVSLTRSLRTRDLPRLFGGISGRFVHYPTDDF